MITSSFGRPEPQFINNPCRGSSYQFINDNQYQTIKYGSHADGFVQSSSNFGNDLNAGVNFNEYRKNAPCSVLVLGK